MSGRTPKLATVRSAWCRAHPFWATTDVEERVAEFDRMIAEVERAAAQKAWTEGARSVEQFYQSHNAAYQKTPLPMPENPYRRNEGEK